MAVCLSDDEMLAFVQGLLVAPARSSAEGHLEECRDCRTVAAEVARSLHERSRHDEATAATIHDSPVVAPLPPRSLIGENVVARYRIIAPIGAGGSGVVYEAFDPQLGRKIALKMVRPDSDESGRSRLLREAQAMARLAHPNVVSVHDAGTYEGQVFLAMELVDGRTLARWLEEERPRWPEIVRVFLAAGDGLAAAHAAGLIHRDFKPENVLVGRDGRPRVTDFGLARTSDGRPEPEGAAPERERPLARPLLTLTEPGARAGTPAYMAPEQFEGARADERTDQFNFCSALYKALYRQRPFGEPGGDTLTMTALARDVIAGKMREPPPSDVPAAVLAILRRGLSRHADDRFPSMAALLEALAAQAPAASPSVPGRRSRPRTVVIASAVMVAALVGLGASRRRPLAPVAPAVVEARVRPAPPALASAAPVEAPPPPAVRTRPPAHGARKEARVAPRPAPPPPAPVPPSPARYGRALKDPFGGP